MALTAVAAGCAGSADEPVPDFPVRPEASYSMGLYLELGDGVPAASRATPEGDYDSGTDFENYIHITDGNPDLRIYLLDTDDYVICEVASPEVMRLNNAPGRKTYELHFEVDSLFKSGYDLRPFKMLMLVNHRGRYPAVLPGISRLSDIVGAPYTIAEYSQAWPAQLNAESRIPMFGIVEFSGVAHERENMVVNGQRQPLLRGQSKVEVTDADVSEDKIIGVSVTRHNL
ncbi:MAG: hypothetical protein K2O12_01665, partial [Muribaculaceae bacterium]|nr:hypothetical protein [Muribaculaceae bacterium]